jgi:hypothetical protein
LTTGTNSCNVVNGAVADGSSADSLQNYSIEGSIPSSASAGLAHLV